MSETARIREAARSLSRQRPELTGGTYTPEAKPSAIDLVPKYRELAQRAAQDLNRRIRGIEGLFGEDAARPIEAAAEELRECFYAALEMHDVAHHDRDQYVQRLRTEHTRQTGELLDRHHAARRLLFEALDEHDARQRRIAPARRKTPEWVMLARAIDDRAPF